MDIGLTVAVCASITG